MSSILCNSHNFFVIQVGGKERFGPWIKLLHALNGGSSTGSFTYLVVPDGDATSEAIEAFKNSGVNIPDNARKILESARGNFNKDEFDEWRMNLNKANNIFNTSTHRVPLCFLEGDLEWAIFSNLSDEKCKEMANSIEVEYKNKNDFIRKMGSKAVNGRTINSPKKHPYMRKQIAERIALTDLSQSIHLVLKRWLTDTNAGIAQPDMDNLFSDQ